MRTYTYTGCPAACLICRYRSYRSVVFVSYWIMNFAPSGMEMLGRRYRLRAMVLSCVDQVPALSACASLARKRGIPLSFLDYDLIVGVAQLPARL